MMKNINKIIFEELKKIPNKIILIIFWVELCSPCELMKNIIESMKLNYKKNLKLLKININYNDYLTEKFSIKTAPTIIIIKNKKILFKKTGITNRQELNKILKKIK